MAAPTLATNNAWWDNQIGYHEYGTNGNKYASCAGHANHQPWCATCQVCCSKSIKQKRPSGASTAGTVANAAAFRRAGKLTTTPHLGAEAFVADSRGYIVHVGRVRKIETRGGVKYVITDEGNHGNAVGRSRRRALRLPGTAGIACYGVLPYSAPAKPKKVAPRSPKTTSKLPIFPLPNTKAGHKRYFGYKAKHKSLGTKCHNGNATFADARDVLWIKQRLAYHGYWPKGLAMSAVAGPQFDKAVRAFQRHVGIKASGLVGGGSNRKGGTWAALAKAKHA